MATAMWFYYYYYYYFLLFFTLGSKDYYYYHYYHHHDHHQQQQQQQQHHYHVHATGSMSIDVDCAILFLSSTSLDCYLYVPEAHSPVFYRGHRQAASITTCQARSMRPGRRLGLRPKQVVSWSQPIGQNSGLG